MICTCLTQSDERGSIHDGSCRLARMPLKERASGGMKKMDREYIAELQNHLIHTNDHLIRLGKEVIGIRTELAEIQRKMRR